MDDNDFFAMHQSIYARAQNPTPVTYAAWHIVLSFFTSLIGCITTLELLQRRTSVQGLYNWYILCAAAITMGGFGIWAMHFVGNRAIVLEAGDPERQILYNPGYTALSFFMPIVVLVFAFYTLGVTKRARHVHVALAACLTGAAVCGMHYLGQLGIENYHCSYHIENVIGAAIISVFASFVALSVFFRLREKWTDSWWKRGLCGVALALAVSGMHWTAAVGTVYRWKGDLSVHGSSRNITSIIASTLSIASCLVLLVIAIIRGRNFMAARSKAQRLVLACAYFDDEGRIMVTQEGVLPSEKITNHYVEKNLGEDELGRSQTTFLWIYRASRNWPILRDLIPGMKDYLESDPVARKYRPNYNAPSISDESNESPINFAPIFKQLFCVAAQQLATLIHEPLERVGVLFEEPLETGAVPLSGQAKTNKNDSAHKINDEVDIEGGSSGYGLSRGKYLFLNRRLTTIEVNKFASLGYRFASVGQISDTLAKSMQTSRERLVSRFERMKVSTTDGILPPPGVHLACFMVRPSMYKSFDVLVKNSCQSQLPYATIRSQGFTHDQMYQLRMYNDMTVNEVMTALANPTKKLQLEDDTRWHLYNAFVKLLDVIGDASSMMEAKFCTREFHVPCQSKSNTRSSTCTLLTVRVLRDIHTTSPRKELTYVPLSFFGAQQHELTVDTNDDGFSEMVRNEFGHLSHANLSRHKMSGSVRIYRRSSSSASSHHGTDSPRSAMFRNPLGAFRSPRRRSDETTIMVDHEKSSPDIELTNTPSSDSSGGFEGQSHTPQSNMAEVVIADYDRGSWVTELFGLFRLRPEGWSSSKTGGWKWDINVENSFEVGTKDRGPGE